MNERVLGVVMAGGRNTRYGAIKALETVGGVRIIDRVIGALASVTDESVLIANDPAAYATVSLPVRSDRQPDLGPLGGIQTALSWAREKGLDGALVVACDMPFASAELLRHLVEQSAVADVVIPESDGRRGIEPLCAYYGVAALPAVESAIARGDLRMISFHEPLRVQRIPLADVQRFGDPAMLFMNVNTPEERERADALARA